MAGRYNGRMHIDKLRALRLLAIGFVFLGLGLAASLLLQPGPQTARPGSDIRGLMWPHPKKLQAFQLRQGDGTAFTLDKLKGHWSFLFFGYTHCPDVCPTTLAMLNQVDALLEQSHAADRRQFVFVSVDPERDTLPLLKDYVGYFNPSFIGVTGSPEQLPALTHQLGILHVKAPQANGKDYLVDHSAAILLIDPAVRVVGIFSPPHQARDIATRFLRMRRFLDSQD